MSTDGAYEPIFVAKQPIFDRDMDIWGHELLFRHSADTNRARITDADQATAKVIVDGFSLVQSGMGNKDKALVNFPRRLLLDGSAELLPAAQVVVEILETVEPEPEVVEACKRLKKVGYTLALDDFVGRPGYEPLLDLADIVKVDVLGMDADRVRSVAGSLGRHDQCLLAEKVEDLAMFDLTRSLGFTLFQGFFFSKPTILSGRKLTASQISKIKLLEELEHDDLDMSRLAEIIQTDVSLSYRLLRYINSPGFGLGVKVESIRRAVAMMGSRALRRWLRVTIMSDLDQSGRGYALVSLSAQRAMYLQALGRCATRECRDDPDGLFLLGFFSLLGALLDQSMEELIDHLPLDSWLKTALIDPSAPEAAWLRLVEAQERGDWERVAEYLDRLGLDPVHSAEQYYQARIWADSVLGSSRGPT